jgi:hypothetical protein
LSSRSTNARSSTSAREEKAAGPGVASVHADLLDQLDRAGVQAVGYDVLFADRSTCDPEGDQALDALAAGGEGRFVFAATRMHRITTRTRHCGRRRRRARSVCP